MSTAIDTLLRSGQPITVLLEAESSAGARYASNTGYVAAIGDTIAPHRAYPDWLERVPEIREELPDQLWGRSNIGWSEAVISNPAGVRDGWLTEAWDGRPVRLLVGARDWDLSAFESVFDGLVTGIQTTAEGALRLTFGDRREQLNAPVQETLLTDGPSEGEPVPLAYGSIYNVEPPVIDTANHRYVVNEGAVTSIDDARIGGLTVSYTPNAAAGRFDSDVFPDGRVTADVTAPLSTAAELLVAIAARRGITDVDTDAMDALDIAAPYPLGLWIGPERRNAIEIIDEIAASVGAWWGFDSQARLTAAVADIGAPVLTLTADDIEQHGLELEEIQLPVWRQRVGYRRNWTVQTDGLYAAVAEDDRQRFGREYDIAEASDGAVQTAHPLARDPDLAGTLLVDGADALDEAVRRLALLGVQRRRYRLRCTRRAWQLRAGQTVTLVYPRYGLQEGVDLLVTYVSRRLDSRTTELRLWG